MRVGGPGGDLGETWGATGGEARRLRHSGHCIMCTGVCVCVSDALGRWNAANPCGIMMAVLICDLLRAGEITSLSCKGLR